MENEFERWAADLADSISGGDVPACECCQGTGYTWTYVSYGNGPVAHPATCGDCGSFSLADYGSMAAAYEDAGLEVPPSP